MTYIVKLVCLFVLFVAFEIGTEAQNVACYGKICSNYVIYQSPSCGTLYPLKSVVDQKLNANDAVDIGIVPWDKYAGTRCPSEVTAGV